MAEVKTVTGPTMCQITLSMEEAHHLSILLSGGVSWDTLRILELTELPAQLKDIVGLSTTNTTFQTLAYISK